MQQIVPVGTTTYKESIRKTTIDLIFATLLLSESLISYGMENKFDDNSDHQPILSQCMLQTIDSPLNSRLFFSKIDVIKLKKALLEELIKDSPCHSQTANKLDTQICPLIGAIETAIALAIPKVRLSPKSVLQFDEQCKKTQIKTRKLKKIWKIEETVEILDEFRLAQAERGWVIAKAKKKVYRKSKKEAYDFLDSI